jgi:hypothetical protein
MSGAAAGSWRAGAALARYRHTTPEMGVRVAAAIQERLVVAVRVAEAVLELDDSGVGNLVTVAYGTRLARPGRQSRSHGSDGSQPAGGVRPVRWPPELGPRARGAHDSEGLKD